MKLFTPGPVQIPQRVIDTLSLPSIYHRSSEFKFIYRRIKDNLKKIFLNSSDPVVLTSSGTGAMEAAIVNLCNINSKNLVLESGRFSKRWAEILTLHGLYFEMISIDKGYSFTPDLIKDLNLDVYDNIFITHCETSTGTISDLKILCKYIKENSNALILADCISSAGAVELRQNDWDIDILISASQKGLLSPPGLSIISYSQKAFEKLKSTKANSYYFDLMKEIKASENDITAWTPSVVLFRALQESTDMLTEGNINEIWKSVSRKAEYFRINSQLIGFKLFSKSPSDSVTALIVPENVKAMEFSNKLKKYFELYVAGGQEELKDKIIRISHMGDLSINDYENLIDAMKYTLENYD